MSVVVEMQVAFFPDLHIRVEMYSELTLFTGCTIGYCRVPIFAG